MKLVAISDTHGNKIKGLPEADILIHAGDWSSSGSYKETRDFVSWLQDLKHKYDRIVCTPGNHDIYIEKNEVDARRMFKDNEFDLLIDESIEYKGLNIHGHPWCPIYGSWSYMKDVEFRLRKASFIPDNTDILITHSPAYGILDKLDIYGSEPGKNVGCQGVLQAIERIKPKLHVSGHIHCQSGMQLYNNTICVNAASVNEQYQLSNQFKVIYI